MALWWRLQLEVALAGDKERAAMLQQIHEVLPGYGDGFLVACLDSCGYNAERVIAQLLEGTLPGTALPF